MLQKLAIKAQAASWARQERKTDEGASAVEYGLLIGGVAVVVVGAIFAFGETLSDLFSGLGERMGEIEVPEIGGGEG